LPSSGANIQVFNPLRVIEYDSELSSGRYSNIIVEDICQTGIGTVDKDTATGQFVLIVIIRLQEYLFDSADKVVVVVACQRGKLKLVGFVTFLVAKQLLSH